MICRVSDGYLNWLMDKVGVKEEYIKLFIALSNREFTWFVDNDENRAVDGLNLRSAYGYFTGLENKPCTVLEMLIGLSIRVGEEILWDGETDYSEILFWKMIENLHLETMTNDNFDEKYFNSRIDIFLNREYENDGDGALFKLSHFHPKSQKRWKNTEIWFQMQTWINENF